MDLSRFSPSGWLALLAPSGASDALVAALVSALSTLMLVVGFAPWLARATGRQPAAAPDRDGGACDYLINGASLKALTEPARALLLALPQGGARLAALAAHFAADCPSLQVDLESLVLYGAGFRHHCPRGDGTAFEIVGEPRGGAAYLSIRAASEEARALKDAEAMLARTRGELAFLREVLDRAPVMAWSRGPDGQITWANAPYRDRFDARSGGLPDHRITDGFGHVIEEVPLTTRGAGLRRRVAVPGRDGAEPRWYELSEARGTAGDTVGFAHEADDLVAAEASLRRFVETLTETFAHLPIGLAVFDKNRRLGLFNPALTDLVKIDAVWLAGRPSLRDFLERLRETRQMPEQKDFTAWRRKLSELEEGAREGTYEENWQLPSGKIFRVTGRPHPQGALAFLFEDISTSIQLERKYRSELELSQATLDRMAEAVAVFDASGMLVFVNSAFERLWGLDPMDRLDGPGVAQMTGIWAERCAPTPVWARLAEFATAAEARTSWTATVETRDGRALVVLVAPLPDASALVVFRAEAGEASPRPEPGRDPALDELAFEQVVAPAEAAVQKLLAAIPAAQSTEAFQTLGAAAQALKDGLARGRELRALAGTRGTGPLPGLAAALAARGMTLATPVEAATWPPAAQALAMALGLAAAEVGEGSVTMRLDTGPAGRRLVAVTDRTRAGRPEGPGVAVARRIAQAAGTSLELRPEGPGVALSALLLADSEAPAEARRA